MNGLKNERIIQIEGKQIRITSPHKVLFPNISLTKWEWILHLTRLAPWILSYAQGRYLTIIRWPDGVKGKSFYQKKCPTYAPEWIPTARHGKISHIVLQDTPTLIWLANLASLEFHLSFDQVNRPDYPSELVFDLDPSVEGFDRVIETALLTREVLNSLGLDGIVKTSGATGLQIYVPIQPHFTFEQIRPISQFIARYLADRRPDLVTVERQIKNRGDKVYVDYLQHWRGKSLIAPYSTRARPKAPVSTPLRWEELKPGGLIPDLFTVETIHRRLAMLGDPFRAVIQPAKRYDLQTMVAFFSRKLKN